jgi:hypothetical protein
MLITLPFSYEEDLLMYTQSSSSSIENMTTHEFAQLISSIVLVLERLPDIPLEELKNLANEAEEKRSKPVHLTYKGVPIYLSQKENLDDWSASVEWYGRSMDVDLEEMEIPTRENVMLAAYRLINILIDIRDKGAIHPDSYFIGK